MIYSQFLIYLIFEALRLILPWHGIPAAPLTVRDEKHRSRPFIIDKYNCIGTRLEKLVDKQSEIQILAARLSLYLLYNYNLQFATIDQFKEILFVEYFKNI